jgi:predicted nucleotidyltransferase
MDRESIIGKLQANKAILQKKYPLASVALFGSFARGEQSKESDIDILVELNGPMGIEFVDLLIDLEQIFGGHKVDLVSKRGVKPRYWPFIQKDLIYV